MNPYDKRKYLFRKYDIVYRNNTKRLIINKPINVNDFILVKELTRNYKIDEIIVEPRCDTRV